MKHINRVHVSNSCAINGLECVGVCWRGLEWVEVGLSGRQWVVAAGLQFTISLNVSIFIEINVLHTS